MTRLSHTAPLSQNTFGRVYHRIMRVLFPLLAAATAMFAQKSPGFDPGALNRAIDPCVNFYQFACGGWMTANAIPSDQSRWGRFDLLQETNRTVLQNLLESAS